MGLILLLTSIYAQQNPTAAVAAPTPASTAAASSTVSVTSSSILQNEDILNIEKCTPYINNIKTFYTGAISTLVPRLKGYITKHDWTQYDPANFKLPPIDPADPNGTKFEYEDFGHKYLLINNEAQSLKDGKAFCHDKGKKAELFRIESYDDWKVVKDKKLTGFWVPLKTCSKNPKVLSYTDGTPMPSLTEDNKDRSYMVGIECIAANKKYVVKALDFAASTGPPVIQGLPQNSQKLFKVVCEIPKSDKLLKLQKIGESKDEFKIQLNRVIPSSQAATFNTLFENLEESPNCQSEENMPNIMDKFDVKENMEFLAKQPKLSATILSSVYDKLRKDMESLANLAHEETINDVLTNIFKGTASKSSQDNLICDCVIVPQNLHTVLVQVHANLDALQDSITEFSPDTHSTSQQTEEIEEEFAQEEFELGATKLWQSVKNQKGAGTMVKAPGTMDESFNTAMGIDEDFFRQLQELGRDISLTETDLAAIVTLIYTKTSADAKTIYTNLPESDKFSNRVNWLINQKFIEHIETSHNIDAYKRLTEEVVHDFDRDNHLTYRIDELEKKSKPNNVQSIVRNYLRDYAPLARIEQTNALMVDHITNDQTISQIRDIAYEETQDYLNTETFRSDFVKLLNQHLPEVSHNKLPEVRLVVLSEEQKLDLITSVVTDPRIRKFLVPNQDGNLAIEDSTVEPAESPTGTTQQVSVSAASTSPNKLTTSTTDKTSDTGENLDKLKEWTSELHKIVKEAMPDDFYQIIALVMSIGATIIGIINCYTPVKKEIYRRVNKSNLKKKQKISLASTSSNDEESGSHLLSQPTPIIKTPSPSLRADALARKASYDEHNSKFHY